MRTPRVSPDIATALRLIRRGPAWSLDGSAFITPLSPLALELLRPHLKADPAARLFDLDRHDLQAAARRIVAGLGMDKWPPHDVRRTAATILDREGYSLEQIGALLATPARRDGGIHAVGQVRLAAQFLHPVWIRRVRVRHRVSSSQAEERQDSYNNHDKTDDIDDVVHLSLLAPLVADAELRRIEKVPYSQPPPQTFACAACR